MLSFKVFHRLLESYKMLQKLQRDWTFLLQLQSHLHIFHEIFSLWSITGDLSRIIHIHEEVSNNSLDELQFKKIALSVHANWPVTISISQLLNPSFVHSHLLDNNNNSHLMLAQNTLPSPSTVKKDFMASNVKATSNMCSDGVIWSRKYAINFHSIA